MKEKSSTSIKKKKPLRINNYKKIIFIMIVSASIFFNVSLFSSIGINFYTKILWAIVGSGAVIFQALKLREFNNCKKKSQRLKHLTLYIIFTIISIAGTIGSGISQIEKNKLKNSDKTVKVEIIEMKINDIENLNKNITDEAINNVIKKTNINQWALVTLLKEKKELTKRKPKNYNKLEDLKLKKVEILQTQTTMINSLSGLAKLFNIETSKISFIFLILIASALEMMLYGSATFNSKLFSSTKTKNKKINKVEKQKKAGQIFMKKTT